MSDKSQDVLNRLVEKYRIPKYFSKYGYCKKVEFVWLMNWIKDKPKDMKILDCCCGIGLLAKCLNERGYMKYYGLDRNPIYVEAGTELLERLALQGEIIEGDVHKLTSYYDERVDLITVFDTVYFSRICLRGVAEQVFRLLNPGGWFVFDFAEQKHIPSEVNLYSRKEVRQILHRFSKVSFSRMGKNKTRWMVVAGK